MPMPSTHSRHTTVATMILHKTYSELISIQDYYERYEYLKLNSRVGALTFGYERYLNQALYNSTPWRQLRTQIIVRDNANDMACEGYSIDGRVIVHHINPITIEMVENGDPAVFDPENLVCVSHDTHEAIHYGDQRLLIQPLVERKRGDTKLW